MQKQPVRICIGNAGLDGYDGPTHHGMFDLSFMRAIPNLVSMSPKDENELQHMIKTAIEYDTRPIAMRYPDGPGFGVKLDKKLKVLDIGASETIEDGPDLSIIAIGNMVAECRETINFLKQSGINASLINARFSKPLDEKVILKEAKKGLVVTAEDNLLKGGFGSGICELLADHKIKANILRFGIPDCFPEQARVLQNRKELRMDAQSIAEKIIASLKKA